MFRVVANQDITVGMLSSFDDPHIQIPQGSTGTIEEIVFGEQAEFEISASVAFLVQFDSEASEAVSDDLLWWVRPEWLENAE